MSDLVETKGEDFYQQLIELINKAQQKEAVKLFETLGSKFEQLKTLYQITSPLAHELARIGELAREFDNKAGDIAHAHDLARYIDIDLAFDLELDRCLVSASDLVPELAHVHKLAHALDHSLALPVDLTLAYDIARARELARALDHSLAYPQSSTYSITNNLTRADNIVRELTHASDIARADDLARYIAGALDHILDIGQTLDRAYAQVCFILAVPLLQDEVEVGVEGEIILNAIDILTPHNLTSHVAPFLEALADIQTLISNMKNEPVPTFVITKMVAYEITKIGQINPITVHVRGISEAVESYLNIIIPWRREHGKAISRFIRDKTADPIEKRASVDHKDKDLARRQLEHDFLQVEADKPKIRRPKEVPELMDLALRIVQAHAPNIQESDQLEYGQRLLDPIYEIVTSEL